MTEQERNWLSQIISELGSVKHKFIAIETFKERYEIIEEVDKLYHRFIAYLNYMVQKDAETKQ